MVSVRAALAKRFGDETSTAVDIETDGSPALELAVDIMTNPQTVETRDGRQLGYAELGDPDGDPLLVFHGFPNSRVFGALFDEIATEGGKRVIAPDRPGFGVSDPDPDRRLTDWPADVADLADALDIEEFSVVGISGGGPYTAVTAALLGDRVERAAIGCGLAPMQSIPFRQRLWYYSGRFFAPGNKLALWLAGRQALDDREAFLAEMADSAAPADRDYWTGDVGKILHASMVESRRHHGLDPLVTETSIYASPWGFDLSTIDVPVGLWYGKADALVPPAMGLYLAEKIPTAEAHIYPDLDHLSVVKENEAAIMEWLSQV